MELKTNCYDCEHRRNIPGDAHSACARPYFLMRGNPRAVEKGWFFYPFNFDPIWRVMECPNFSPLKTKLVLED